VAGLLEKAYVEQFPKDPKMLKYLENLPNFKISEEIREKIKEHEYNEDIQEKYFNAAHKEAGSFDDPKFAMIDILYKEISKNKKQTSGDDIVSNNYLKRMGEDLDDELVKRINLHLNENHQKNIKVLDSL
jgi:hypothetical protein